MLKIVKDASFRAGLVECLNELEPHRDNSLILDMLKNYFNSRNKGFGSNWVLLPSSRAILHINNKGIYFCPEYVRKKELAGKIPQLNSKLKESVGFRNWTVAFREPYNNQR